MTEKIHDAWEQVTLSPQADERIRGALAAAQQEQKVIPLRRGLRRTTRIALIAAVIIGLLSVTALGINMGRIVLREKTVQVVGPDNVASEYEEIDFEPTTQGPIYMGLWVLDVPEGYEETERSWYMDGDAANFWENADGKEIRFNYMAADLPYGQSTIVQETLDKQDITVNGAPALLYVFQDSSLLVWTNDEIGVGFELSCNDSDIDIIALAETAHQVDEKPKPRPDTLIAIAELGDWNPVLPEGYSEYISYGMPAEYGGPDGYSYVWHTYVNGAGYTINLRYEIAYSNVDHVGGYQDLYNVSDVTVQGWPGGLVENLDGSPYFLVWDNEEVGLTFRMMAEELTSEELLAVAESVALAP